MVEQFSPLQRQAFEAFASYPWQSDGVFQAGLENILEGLPPDNVDSEKLSKAELDNRQLLRAKHFFFTRFRQNFDLEEYLLYEKQKNIPVEESPAIKAYRRLEAYDFDNDNKFLSGLPTIVRGWVNQQKNGNVWDKTRMDDEYVKAKAFYYASCVEPVSVADYITWTKNRQEAAQPACPFAHMWQNKKRAGDDVTEAAAGNTFVSTEEPAVTGAATITFSGSKSNNIFTVDRLKELYREELKAENNRRATSRVLRPVAISIPNVPRNTKISSSGLAFVETADKADEKNLLASLDAVADAYYNLVLSTFQLQKTTVTVFDAAIPANAPYIALWHGFVRVITEDTYLDLGLDLSYAPIPPLLLLSLCRPRMQSKQPLPAGTELYLALAPPESVRLRGPELLRLGLADIFVPDARLNEAVTGIKRMAMCPEPDTSTALQLVLAAYHSYPGPDRLGVWEKEIQQTFGMAETLDGLKNKLKEMNNRWSNKILDHWKTLPSALVEAVFKAVKACSEMDPAKVLTLERRLNQQWRRTKDFEQWRKSGTEWDTDPESVEFYFKEVEKSSSEDPVVYEAPKEDDNDGVAVCPVTGQRSDGAVCPVTGQAQAASCPVTGQKAEQQADAPEQQSCPVTGQKAAVCPVTGQA
ncbi:hypothetical protein BJV82DRAFT_617865 [Fennellomyces sp. T-0311]|nr:hypothetical protein BJV82DRAFT_617865 [Fennellomyces sp. T-0311]